MKARICFFLLLLIGAVRLQAVEASLTYAVFRGPESPYLELYLYILGNSVRFEQAEGETDRKQSSVEVLVLIKQGEEIVRYDKFRLNSPASAEPLSYADVKRLALKEGVYTLEVEITDLHNPAAKTLLKENIEVKKDDKHLVSDVQLLGTVKKADDESPFVKNGLFMENLPFNFYGRHYKTLSFYCEVYAEPVHTGESYLLQYSILRSGGSGHREPVRTQYTRRTHQPVDPIVHQWDISKLPSGDYILQVSLIDTQKNPIYSSEVAFVRSNPEYDYQETLAKLSSEPGGDNFTEKLDSTELRYALRALVPRIPQTEAEVLKLIIGNKELPAMRSFLFNFYEKENPQSPEAAYMRYMEVARAVDKTYQNGFGYGFESDRGFFFLKYGKPDNMQVVNDDPVAPPYEIWFYNKLLTTNQSNVRFVFYNPSLAHNGHVLLHSTARGEWNNPKWEVQLYRNAGGEMDGDNYIDGTRMQQNWNRHARRFYDDY